MKKLQKKLIGIAFASAVAVFGVMALGLFLILGNYNARRADSITRLISYGGGMMPEVSYSYSSDGSKPDESLNITLNDETKFRARYFTVFLDEDGGVEDVLTDHIASIDEETAESYASIVLSLGRKTGYYFRFRFRVADSDQTGKRYVIFLDCADDIMAQKDIFSMISVTLLFFALAITLVFAIFSKRILEPFEKNQLAQKEFITDASHELKTPLAVISANADVLKYKSGSNEWVDNIVSQTRKMSKLINQLLLLARMEEMGERSEKESMDLSATVESSAAGFKEIFERRQVAFETEIEPGIVISANRSQMETLCEILLENASKYVDEGGRAGVVLKAQGSKVVSLSIYNSSEKSADMDCDRIFERFYRTDKSRSSSTGGHGIGLSIAKRIVDQHKGKITASVDGEIVSFEVKLDR